MPFLTYLGNGVTLQLGLHIVKARRYLCLPTIQRQQLDNLGVSRLQDHVT